MVDVPGNRTFPSSISPRIHPRLHISTPFVYLWTKCSHLTHASSSSLNCVCATTDAHLEDPSKISGALYHLVATYSVSAGFPLSSWIWFSDRARPKSQSLTTQSASKSTLDGCIETHDRVQKKSQSEHLRKVMSTLISISYEDINIKFNILLFI